MKNVHIILLTVCVLSSCVSAPATKFTVISLDEEITNKAILQAGVIGEDCPSGLSGYGSYSAATDLAISKVEGANALINAKFSRAERPLGKICVRVVGDAVKL